MAAAGGGGMSQFYGQMPDNFTIAVNGNHPIVADILSDAEKAYGDKLKSITKKIDAAVPRKTASRRLPRARKRGAYPRREIHARGVVEEGRHAAR